MGDTKAKAVFTDPPFGCAIDGFVSSKGSDEGDILAEHPTPKPVRLVADALLDTTRRGAAMS